MIHFSKTKSNRTGLKLGSWIKKFFCSKNIWPNLTWQGILNILLFTSQSRHRLCGSKSRPKIFQEPRFNVTCWLESRTFMSIVFPIWINLLRSYGILPTNVPLVPETERLFSTSFKRNHGRKNTAVFHKMCKQCSTILGSVKDTNDLFRIKIIPIKPFRIRIKIRTRTLASKRMF